MMSNPLLSKLGYGSEDRLVIFHADDLGLCHGSNQAFLELNDAGIVRSGSVMSCAPWAAEILQICQQNPELDIGVHLTLNSEWSGYRWGPVSTCDKTSGLIDSAGYFWQTPEQVCQHARTDTSYIELVAQIERVRSYGVDFTHIDAHMRVAALPQFIGSYIQLGIKYQVPIIIERHMNGNITDKTLGISHREKWRNAVYILETRGLSFVDWFYTTPCYHFASDPGEPCAEIYQNILCRLQPGITFFSLHPNTPVDIKAIAPATAQWRIFEYEYFQSQDLQKFLSAEGIIPIGLQEIRAVMRSS